MMLIQFLIFGWSERLCPEERMSPQTLPALILAAKTFFGACGDLR